MNLIAHSISDLQLLSLETGLERAHKPSDKVMRELCHMYGNLTNVKVCSKARSGARTITLGDAVWFYHDGSLTCGEVWLLFAAEEMGNVAIVGRWELLQKASNVDFWKFKMFEEVIEIPLGSILDASVWHRGNAVANVLCPPQLMLPRA